MNPWRPMTRPLDLKHLGKLAEECGELSAAISRCIIQGIDEREPVTGKPNHVWLSEEIADVLANIRLVQEHFRLGEDFIRERVGHKIAGLRKWHRMIDDAAE